MCPNIRANDTDTFFFDAAGSAPTESETGMSLSLHRPATGQQLGHAHIRLSLDIRSPLDATVDALEVALREDFVGLARGEPTAFVVLPPGGRQPLTVAWQTDPVSATRFHPDCIAAVRDAAHSVLVQRSRR
ncbi:hypothetical protein SCUCBS95973_001357 [Sporothrix curviconia]|uniref:Uncharacterized protein n=1 Tax=Sporothrix curviconia TaxID=1260050 RepID=A0ABP0AY47_9PEZI